MSYINVYDGSGGNPSPNPRVQQTQGLVDTQKNTYEDVEDRLFSNEGDSEYVSTPWVTEWLEGQIKVGEPSAVNLLGVVGCGGQNITQDFAKAKGPERDLIGSLYPQCIGSQSQTQDIEEHPATSCCVDSLRSPTGGASSSPILVESESLSSESLSSPFSLSSIDGSPTRPSLDPSPCDLERPKPLFSPSSSIHEDTKQAQVVDIKNDATTTGYFAWKDNGHKKSKNLPNTTCEHYKCKQLHCKAKYRVTTSPGRETTVVYLESHNHQPPDNPPIRKQVKKDFIGHLKLGVSPAVLHKHAVNNAPLPLSSADVPSIGQLNTWKYRESMKDMPTGDVLHNIITKHRDFVRMCHLPNVRIALMSDFGLRTLKDSDVFFVDGTFRTTECKLILTILLALSDGLAVPAAYFLSDSRETTTYKSFFEVVRAEGKNTINVHLDFEEALGEGFSKVFPDATIMRDFFHFVQANVKQAGKLGMKSVVMDIVKDLNVLWYKPTKAAFDVHLDREFLHKWDSKAPQYSAYFRSTWLERYPPREWASYARPSDSSSGSGDCEAFNARLDKILPDKPLALDKMVDFLAEEDEYWCRTMSNSHLKQVRKDQKTKSQAAHTAKRRRLSHYYDRNKDVTRRSESINVWDICNEDTEDLSSSVLDDTDNIVDERAYDFALDALEGGVLDARQGGVLEGVPKKGNRLANDRKETCKGCGQLVIINKACDLHPLH